MAGDAVELAEDHPDVLGAFRYLQSHEFLDRPAVDLFVVEVGYVIHAVEQGDYLVILLAFAKFFRAPVQIANMGHHVNNLLTVHPQHHAEHAMG